MSKRKSRKIVINAPKYHYPGKGRPREELAYISPREKRGLLNSTDHTAEMTKHGVLSFADDSASSKGVSRGDKSQGTTGSGQTQGGSSATTGSGNLGGSSSSHASAANRASTMSAPGGKPANGPPTGTSQGSQQKSANAATGPDRYGGSSNAGGMGQNPAQGTPASPGMGTPNQGSKQSQSPGGSLLGANPAQGRPDSPGMSTPNSGSSLLGATRAPKSINDRIGVDLADQGRGPLGPTGLPSGFDPSRPVGAPPSPTGGFDPLSGIQSPAMKAKKNFVEGIGIAEKTVLPTYDEKFRGSLNPYDSTFNYGKAKFKGYEDDIRVYDPITPTETTITDTIDWQNNNRYFDPKYDDPQAPVVGISQFKPDTLARAAKSLGYDPDTTVMTPAVQDNLTMEVNRLQGLSAWDSLNKPGMKATRAALTADYNAAKGAAKNLSGSLVNNQGITPDYNNEGRVALGGISDEDQQQGVRDAILGSGAFGQPERPFSGASPTPSGKGNFGDPSGPGIGPDPGPSISPAGGPAKQFPNDRLAQDPNFDPRNNPNYKQAPQLGDEPGVFGPVSPKTINERVPDFNPNALQPETENEVIGDYVNPPIPREKPALTRSLLGSKAITDRIPPTFDPRMNPEPSDLDPNSPFQTTPGPHVPGQAPVVAEPENISPQVPTKVTTHTSKPDIYGETKEYWNKQTPGPTNLNPNVSDPRAARVANTTGRSSDQSRPSPQLTRVLRDIPVDNSVKADVIAQHGEAEGADILATVAAVKQAMGTTPRRGKGIGQLAQAPRRKARRSTNIPEDAPRLEG